MNALQFFPYDIGPGAGRALPVNVQGAFFLLKESTAQMEMQFDAGAKFKIEGGFSIRVPDGFTSLTFFNLSATKTLSFEFYAGGDLVDYHYYREARTRLEATEAVVVSGIHEEFPGISDEGERRKSFMVSNTHATLVLYIRATDGGDRLCAVQPLTTSPILETDADLFLYNGSATGITALVSEIFYLS